jgi:hypothetical protein
MELRRILIEAGVASTEMSATLLCQSGLIKVNGINIYLWNYEIGLNLLPLEIQKDNTLVVEFTYEDYEKMCSDVPSERPIT